MRIGVFAKTSAGVLCQKFPIYARFALQNARIRAVIGYSLVSFCPGCRTVYVHSFQLTVWSFGYRVIDRDIFRFSSWFPH